jgi:hypothetical protein
MIIGKSLLNNNFLRKTVLSSRVGRHFSVNFPNEEGLDPLPPKAVDVLITDINDDDLAAVGDYFQFKRLPTPFFQLKVPLKGKIFGKNSRIFFPVIINRGNKTVIIPMLYDIGAKYSFLRKDTLRALGIRGEISMGAEVNFHGFKHSIVYESHAHFENVDLFGQEFLKECNLELTQALRLLKATLQHSIDEKLDEY